MRKLSAWLIAAALVLSLLPATFATDDTVITVHPPGDGVKAGDTFTVTVDISGNPGFSAAQFTLSYDHDALMCTDIGIGPVLKGMMSVTNPDGDEGAIIAAITLNESADNGQLATFYFTAKQDEAAPSFAVEELKLCTYDGDDIPVRLATETSVGSAPSAPSPTENIPDEAVTATADTPVPRQTETPKPTETAPQPTSPTTQETTKPTQTPETPTTTPTAPTDPETAPQTPTTQPLAPTTTGGTEQEDVVFSDTAGHWAVNWIILAARRGIFKGNPDGTFKPNAPISRGDYVLTLYRMAGEPAVTMTASPFADVPMDAYYAKAVMWAYANGYVSGRGDGFDPKAPVTRQEAMKILFAFSGGQSGLESMFTSVYDEAFSDSGEIAQWAKPAMYWAVYKEIINGMDGGLAPKGQTTRAQLAKILVEYQNRMEREAIQAAKNQ